MIKTKAKQVARDRGKRQEFYDLSRQGQYIYDARPTPMVLLDAFSNVKDAQVAFEDARRAWSKVYK